MLIKFFFMLRSGGLNTSITELLHLLEAMQYGIAKFSVENFYYLSRSILVKDESLFDRFDQIFTAHFSGIEKIINELFKDVPEEWLRKQAQLMLTEEERAQIESMGGFEKLIETLKKRFEEQKDRHQGGSKWIGTAGTSPYGAYGYNPEGIRIGRFECLRGCIRMLRMVTFPLFQSTYFHPDVDLFAPQIFSSKFQSVFQIHPYSRFARVPLQSASVELVF